MTTITLASMLVPLVFIPKSWRKISLVVISYFFFPALCKDHVFSRHAEGCGMDPDRNAAS